MEADKTKKEIYLMDVLDAVRDFNAIYTKAKEFVAAQLRNGVLPEEPLKRFEAALETLNCDMMCNPCIICPSAAAPAPEPAPDPAPEPEAEPEPNPVSEPAPAPEPEPPAGDCPRPKKKYTKKSDYWARLDAARAEREAARESAKAAPGKRPYVKKDPAYWGKFEAARAEKAAAAGSPDPAAELSMDDPGYWEAIEVRKRTGSDAPAAETPEVVPLVDDASCESGKAPKRASRSYGLEKVITKRRSKHSVVNPNSHRRPTVERYGRIDDEAACDRLLRTAVDAFISNGYTTYKQFRERHNNLACALWKRKGLRKRFNDEVNAAIGMPLL